jgi:predicted ATPase
MITSIEIENYKSIVKASIQLSPFTLLIGANGTGKSNFLQLLRQVSTSFGTTDKFEKHVNHQNANQRFVFKNHLEKSHQIKNNHIPQIHEVIELRDIRVFSPDPVHVGQPEPLVAYPTVLETGQGVVQVLDALKTGDREDLFDLIEKRLQEYIPEIEKLSFVPGKERKQLQIREKYLDKPIMVSQLSDGTKLVLIILAILYQENPPTIVCIEEIDRGMHPRLLEKVVQLCFDMTEREEMPQIIATTHNPYLVDQFKGNEDAVIIVEKKDGQSTFTSLAERIKNLEPEEEDPLGQLWFSGFVGGVPVKGV